MADDLRRFIDKLFYLVPVKYWNAIAATVIGGLLFGIGNTVLNRSAPETLTESSVADIGDAPLAAKKRVTLPDTIDKGNIFRKQRQNYVIPPLPPKAAPAAKVEQSSVDFKLVGTIITGPARIAILNADQKAGRKKGPRRARVSGAAAVFAPKPPPAQKSDPQSFHEGDNIFDFVLERVYEDRIELVNLESGESLVVYLEVEEAAPPAPPSVSEIIDPFKKGAPEIDPFKKGAAKPIKVSGAQTKPKGVKKR